VSPVARQSGCGLDVIAPEFFFPFKAGRSYCLQGSRLRDREGTCEPVLIQFVPCVLQFHPCIGREFSADSVIRRLKSRVVLALQGINCAFQVLTTYAPHFVPALPFDPR